MAGNLICFYVTVLFYNEQWTLRAWPSTTNARAIGAYRARIFTAHSDLLTAGRSNSRDSGMSAKEGQRTSRESYGSSKSARILISTQELQSNELLEELTRHLTTLDLLREVDNDERMSDGSYMMAVDKYYSNSIKCCQSQLELKEIEHEVFVEKRTVLVQRKQSLLTLLKTASSTLEKIEKDVRENFHLLPNVIQEQIL